MNFEKSPLHNIHRIDYSNPCIIGIIGGFKGGMTTVSNYISDNFKDTITLNEKMFLKDIDIKEIISDDEMYLIDDNPKYPKERRIELIKKASPKSYDYEKCSEKLQIIKNSKEKVEINYENKVIEINPGKACIIIIEGYFLLKNPQITKLLDIKIYKDAEDDIRLSRLVLEEKEYLEGNVENCKLFFDIYEKILKKSFEDNIYPDKTSANIVLPDYKYNNSNNELEGEEILQILEHFTQLKSRKRKLTVK
jgi:uridine kinase